MVNFTNTPATDVVIERITDLLEELDYIVSGKEPADEETIDLGRETIGQLERLLGRKLNFYTAKIDAAEKTGSWE